MPSDFSTVKLFNATVVQFSSSLGWNDDVSRVSITLVEDDQDDDAFNPPEVGYPVYFDFGGWVFYGILEKWTRQYSQSGNPIYDVSVVDPRNLLEGVQIILDDYNGYALIPNVVNVYGYLENLYGFGGSQKNDSGIPYLLVGQALISIVNSITPNFFGGNIVYKGTGFLIDLTNLPLLPSNFRIGGVSSMSLMDVIRTICEAGGCEMFFRCELGPSSIPIIKLYTISRTNVPNIGVINQFVTTTDGAVAKEAGLEMVNDVCAKMVFGGKKHRLWYEFYTYGEDEDEDTGYDNTIWPYWGTDLDSNLVVGNYTGLIHTFTLDARNVRLPNIGNTYDTDVGEMIALLSGYDNWVSFLALNWANEYRIEYNGQQTDFYWEVYQSKQHDINGQYVTVPDIRQTSNRYKHNGKLNPHFLKAINLRLTPLLDWNLAQLIGINSGNVLLNTDLLNTIQLVPGVKINVQNEIYNLLSTYAQEYYGRKYMVRVPDVYIAVDTDTLQLTYSDLPVTSAFMDDIDIATAQNYDLLPLDFNGISDEQNKIECFVKFSNASMRNFADIPKDDILIGRNNSIFVKCSLDSTFVYLDGQNYTGARVVVTLPGIVGLWVDPDRKYNNIPVFSLLYHVFLGGGMTTAAFDESVKKLLGNPYLSLQYLSSTVPLAVTPDLAAIPLESQTLLYGPWYINTAIGKTEVEQDESLVPWNYGSTELMNLAGNAKVSEIGVNLQTLEYGNVEYPGLPVLQLGDQLLGLGPYVTDISASVSPGSVTTHYHMKSWSPKFGKMAKYEADRFFKIKKSQYDFARMLRERTRRIVK